MLRNIKRGFTLVELLLVLVILALIAGLVLPGIIGKAESDYEIALANTIKEKNLTTENFFNLIKESFIYVALL